MRAFGHDDARLLWIRFGFDHSMLLWILGLVFAGVGYFFYSKKPASSDEPPAPAYVEIMQPTQQDTEPPRNPVMDREDIIRALEGIQGDISKLRQRLHCSDQHPSNVTEDSKTDITSYSYVERLYLKGSKDNGCRLLTENLHAAVGNLLATLRKGKKVPSSILINDVFVDIFLCLGRVSLDAVQLTCARFDALVHDYLKNFCYRTLTIKIIDLELAPDFNHALPQNHASPGVYCIQIAALHDVLTDRFGEADPYRWFIFESRNLEDVVNKWAEKMTTFTYVPDLQLYGVPNVLERLIEHHQSRAKRMAIGGLYMFAFEGDFVRVPSLLDSLNTLRAVNSVTLNGPLSPNVNAEFFKRCRQMSIFNLRFEGLRHVEVSADALLDYCFGLTRKGLESTPRRVTGLASLDREMPSRLLEAVAKRGKPGPDISIEVWPENDDFDWQPIEEEVRMRYAKLEMVRQQYGDDVDKVYLAQPFEGVDVTCSFFGYYAQFTVQYN
ncbi:hypothetical protein AAVH_32548 [Aphelenchoides avenae]|nr:hypothetical protein AAVH_32548 [Aphelenchus avenae]